VTIPAAVVAAFASASQLTTRAVPQGARWDAAVLSGAEPIASEARR
jgi:hypothetical protein